VIATKLVMFVVSVICAVSVATAAPCQPFQSLAALTAGSCTIGDKVFSDFSLTVFQLDSVSVSSLTPSDIGVQTGATNGNPLLTFVGDRGGPLFDVIATNDIIDFAIGYSVSTTDGRPLIKDLAVAVASVAEPPFDDIPPITATVTENACFGANVPCTTPDVTFTASAGESDSDVFAPVSSLTVSTRIRVEFPAGNSASTFDFVSNEVSQVPEPGTFALVCVVFLVFCSIPKRLRRVASFRLHRPV
jgi:hypothetical protein